MTTTSPEGRALTRRLREADRDASANSGEPIPTGDNSRVSEPDMTDRTQRIAAAVAQSTGSSGLSADQQRAANAANLPPRGTGQAGTSAGERPQTGGHGTGPNRGKGGQSL